MDDNKNDEMRNETPAQPSEQATASKSVKAEPQSRSKLAQWFVNVKSEFSKVIWPTKEVLAKQTLTVIVTSLIVGVIIVAYDAVFALALNQFTNLIYK